MIIYRTRISSGGLGEGFDLLVIDEAQEYTDSQQGTLGYTVSSSPNPQTILCGTPPTAVSKGTVFVPHRETCLSGKADDSMWAEWVFEKLAEDRTDPDLWYETSPSLGQILSERNVRQEVRKMEEVDFNIQRLGLWLTYTQASAICLQPLTSGRSGCGTKFFISKKSAQIPLILCNTEIHSQPIKV